MGNCGNFAMFGSYSHFAQAASFGETTHVFEPLDLRTDPYKSTADNAVF